MAEKIKAVELAKLQREISISEFFTKNRHLLGFDSPRKALLTTIKEAVDNSLDACEEIGVLPDLIVKLEPTKDNRFLISVEDNGPGIVKEQIPNIFAKLLYGSKFHRLRQSRGQQGIGISASSMYAQLTTGKPTKITSKISPKKPAHYYELHIDTKKNEPETITDKEIEWKKDHGTKVEIELEGLYQKGKQSVDEYLKQTAIINPHLSLTYHTPDKQIIKFPRATNELPIEPKEIRPHPYGVELGILINMAKDTKAKDMTSFLTKEFSRVSPQLAKQILEKAEISEKQHPSKLSRDEVDKLIKIIRETKIMAPPTNCLSPIGEDLLSKGLQKELNAEFYTSITRSPAVYRGNPFLIEVAIAYGGDLSKDDLVRVLRFANKVPLLYQQSACASTRSIIQTSWKNYHLGQSRSSLPSGPVVILIHMASAWVPFTSESKEAIAHYPEIIKEMKLALQDCGRKLSSYIRKTVKAREQKERINLFEKYIPELASSLSDLSDEKKTVIEKNLQKTLKKGMKDLLKELQGE
tara:strand:- start:26782 stop:28353 length:1572 start_codon:yes stop_codon:yes gene_type:complete